MRHRYILLFLLVLLPLPAQQASLDPDTLAQVLWSPVPRVEWLQDVADRQDDPSCRAADPDTGQRWYFCIYD